MDEENRVTLMKEMAEKKDGSLKDYLAGMTENGLKCKEELDFLKEAFGRLHNRDLCACGSGKEYHYCCKFSFRLLERHFLAGKPGETTVLPKEESPVAETNEIEWVVKIGLGKNGPVLSPCDENKRAPIEQVADLLDIAARTVRDTIILQKAQKIAIDIATQVFSKGKNGGIVEK
jgi:hypothetical protein